MKEYEQTPLWDNQLPIEERLDYLLKELTIEEKIACLTTGCPDVPRLGIQAFSMGGEAAHGIEARNDQDFNRGEPEHTTSFPQPIGMSASWDKELIKECGRVVGEEARALQKRTYQRGLSRWAPTVDMERDPRWGRTEEAYGEDPCLTGEMASGYIQGMRGNDSFYIQCGATLKHFYANNVELNRGTVSSSIDGRNKNEYYLEPFRRAIVEGGAEAIMTSYNEINGIPAIVNDEVQRVVKEEWGLPGHVVCDGGDMQETVNAHKYYTSHAETVAYGLKAGVDCFTDVPEVVMAAGREALERGLMTEEDMNRSVRNSFRTRIRLGLFDKEGACPYSHMGEDYVNSKEHQQVQLEMAKAAMVLLKNKKDILPLKPEQASTLAVVGPLADIWYKDWYCGIPPYTVTPLAGIREEYETSQITCNDGLVDIQLTCQGKYVGLDNTGRLCLVTGQEAETFTMNDWGSGSYTLQAKSNGLFITLEEKTNLIRAASKEVFGWFVRENWRLKKVGDAYEIKSWDEKPVGIGKDGYVELMAEEDEKVLFAPKIIRDGIEESVTLAGKADYAMVILGSNPVINSRETIDRDTIALPPVQQELAEKICAANPNTIIILVSNYPYNINVLQEKAAAILLTASGSQDLGKAIAQTLSGRSVPAGRLNMTWYKEDADLPDINDYDIMKGKRTYQYFDKEVLYPFGYGLSYSTFEYRDLQVDIREEVTITITVLNTGGCKADEVVQIYVRKDGSRVKRPVKQLKAFTRVKDLAAGESRNVTLTIPLAELRYYDVISERMILEDGEYCFMAGASSQDIRGEVTVKIAGGQAPVRNPFSFTKAEQYDDYENLILHRGNHGYTCIVPQNTTGSQGAEAIYKDMVFTKAPTEMKFDLCAVEPGKVTVLADGKTIAVLEAGADTEFTEKGTAVNIDSVPLDKNVVLELQIYGKIKITGFLFL